MKKLFQKYWRCALAVLFGLGIFLFWYCGYPQALCYQEQNQLFLWSTDYFCRDMSVAGGFADYVSEFLVQFYYVPLAGAIILACVFVAFYLLCCLVAKTFALADYKPNSVQTPFKWYWNVILLLPALLLLAVMGDIEVLLSFPVALTFSLLVVWLMNIATRKVGLRLYLSELLIIPVLFWLIGGGATWLYVFLRIAFCWWQYRKPFLLLLTIPYFLAVQLICYATVLVQYPLSSVMIGINYYRVPMHFPGQKWGYDKDLYALLKQNEQVRNGKWNEIIQDAEKYQVQMPYSSNCVNLALAETRQLADRMFTFYQSGEEALLAPRSRDNMSMYPTMEAFWYLGLVNSSLRYATDLQASILNGKMSGRLMKRMTECQIVNGKYSVARKNIDVLKQSLFYHDWAVQTESLLGNNTAISHDPNLGRAKRMRFKTDMLYSYDEIDKMMGLLFINNPDNKMALDYFMGQMLLKGDIQGFMRYGGWVQQYGGYSQMPYGYADAIKCIQNQGNVPGSPYAEYVKRMMSRQKGGVQ